MIQWQVFYLMVVDAGSGLCPLIVLSSVAPPGDRGPSKGSLTLILPTAWVPSAYKAADGHAFRSAPGLRALCSTDTDADKMV